MDIMKQQAPCKAPARLFKDKADNLFGHYTFTAFSSKTIVHVNVSGQKLIRFFFADIPSGLQR